MAENIQVQDITENDYSIQKAGEEVDALLEKATRIDAMSSQLNHVGSIAVSTKSTVDKMHFGTVEYKLTEANVLMQIPLGLTFAPKQVIATLRQTEAPTPYKTFCTHVNGSGKSYYLNVCRGVNNGPTMEKVPAGTYYVDYIAIE